MVFMRTTEESKLIKQSEKLINYLRFYKNIDKSELSRKLQVSMPTIYKSIDELDVLGIVNKSASPLSICSEFGILIGISIGASLCKIVFLDFNFEILQQNRFSRYKKIICSKISAIIQNDALLEKSINDESRNYVYFKTPKTFSDLKNVINEFFACLCDWIETDDLNVLSIGISCTGIINNKTKTILDAHNLSYLKNTTLDSLIFPDKRAFFETNNIYISLVQNSNAAVIAEKIYLYQIDSPHKNKQNIIALYLGVGTGAGIYLGSLYEGASGHTGEAGHTRASAIESDEVLTRHKDLLEKGLIDASCTCGSVDCYDYKIRSYVFEETAEKFCDKSADQMQEYLSQNTSKAKLLGQYYGNMVNQITNWFNPDLIIFTGKIYKSMAAISNYIDAVRDENPLKYNRNDCEILSSSYGSLSPAIGAAIYAYHKKYELDLSWNY